MDSITHELLFEPLLPPVTYLDILLPPLLIATALLLHTIYNDPPPPTFHAHLYRAKTAHARFLPTEAKHVFCYPVLFFGVDLQALEEGKLDMGRLFAYLPRRWTVTALRPNGYLDPSVKDPKKGIREKLWEHLAKHGVAKDKAESIYTVTMPAYLGTEGINPLTTHFCYSLEEQKGRKLEAVVLEVHNTFGERHLYVLKVGVDEDATVAVGYEHQWTFPRAFHVSPFNDRTGFYRVSLSDPLSSSLTTSLALPSNPSIAIKIIFLTSTLEKKIYASLAGPSTPLTASSLVSSLLRWPFSLLLTTPRILYQAMRLHYAKRLDVFPRPEPFVEEQREDGDVNPIQQGGKEGGVGWQEEGATESFARERTTAFLRRRIDSLATASSSPRNITVVLRPADRTRSPTTLSPSNPSPLPVELLTISYLTPLFFSDLLVSPSIPLALSLGSHTSHRWKTSSDSLFISLFDSSPPTTSPTLLTSLALHLRLSTMSWSLSFLPSPPPLPTSLHPHPLDPPANFALVKTLAMNLVALRIGYWAFVGSRARFVRGLETWGDWARWAGEGGREVGEWGSVRREEK